MSRVKGFTTGLRDSNRAPAARKSTKTDAVICSWEADGHISVKMPVRCDGDRCRSLNWGSIDKRGNVYLAANILCSFLEEMRDPLRQSLRRCDLIQLARPFSEDFLETLPPGGGIIPVDQILAWLARTVGERQSTRTDLHFDEQSDNYDLSGWPDVSSLAFIDHGFVCARNSDDLPCYNIHQRWLRKRIDMEWRGEPLARLTLAANIIDRFLREQSKKTPLRQKFNSNIADCYSAFAEDFLETMPDDGGQIPVSVIHRWLIRNL